MTQLCPRCQLPARSLGRALSAISADGQRFGVIGICSRCTDAWSKLPKKARGRGIAAALDRALDDPARYTVRLFPDIGAADLATALLAHPKYAKAALEALGW
jgi:hypothetical protein